MFYNGLVLGGDRLGYRVKWIEDNLGISRKALRNYEEEGLMPKNEGGKYRDYTEKDIDRIWNIRVLQGVGYSLKEIKAMDEDESFDYAESLEKKIRELEEKREAIERNLGYAKFIKLTGRIPLRPKEMGSVTAQEFYEKSLEGWNLDGDEKASELASLVEKMLAGDIAELSCTQEGVGLMMETVIPLEILKRQDSGVHDDEVQLLVKMLYENRIELFEELKEITKEQFVRCEVNNYLYGDVARMKEEAIGKEGCRFIANAIAVFGGYESSSEVEN